MSVTKEDVQKMMDDHRETCKANPDAWIDFMCPDAKLLPNHSPAITGRDAIGAYYKAKKEKHQDVGMKFIVDTVINEGSLLIVDGQLTICKGDVELDKGKFLHVLKKDGEKFKLIRGMHNTDRPMECGK